MNEQKRLYENFHRRSKNQTKIISKNDFTYQNMIKFTDFYSKKPSRILDIGCGVGSIDLYLASLGNYVTGIDISKKAINIAKQSADFLNLDKHTFFNVVDFPTNIPKGTFDVVICSEILEHLVDDKVAIGKIKNLLKPKGILVTSSPSLNAPLYRLGLLNDFDKKVGHLRRYSEESFIELFKNSGFKILETKKVEGIIRNFLFTNSFGGFLLRVLNKWPFSGIVTFLDNLAVPIFGESDIYLVGQMK